MPRDRARSCTTSLQGLIALAIFGASFSRYETIQHQDVYFFTGCDPAVSGLPGTPKTLNVPVMHVGSLTVPNPVEAIDNIVQITAASLRYHAEECHSHPYSSLWLTWPVMEHPVLFYATSQPNNGPVAQITDMGNPAIWWLGILALLFCVWRLTRGPNWWRLLVALIGLGSLVAMIILYQAAVRYHNPNNFNTSYTASQFTALFHMDPSSQYEIARTYPGFWFAVAFVGMIVFAALVTVSAVISRRFVPAFIVLGYVASWMMWVPGNERRVLFFYHALGMLLFTALALAYALTAIRRIRVPLRRPADIAGAGLLRGHRQRARGIHLLLPDVDGHAAELRRPTDEGLGRRRVTAFLVVLDAALTLAAGAALAGLVRTHLTLAERARIGVTSGLLVGTAATYGLCLLAGARHRHGAHRAGAHPRGRRLPCRC